MKQTQQQSTAIWLLLRDHRFLGISLFFVMLLAAFSEGVGLSLIIPVLSLVTGKIDTDGELSSYTYFVLTLIPEQNRLQWLLVLLVLVFGVKALLLTLRTGMATNFAFKLRESWSTEIFGQYMHGPYAKVIEQKQGALINNVMVEPFRASKGVIFLMDGLNQFILAITLFGLLFVAQWKFALALSVIGVGLVLLLKGSTHRFSVKLGKQKLQLNKDIGETTTEGVGLIKQLKILCLEKDYQSRLFRKLQAFRRLERKFEVLSKLPNHILEFVIVLGIALVLMVVQFDPTGNQKMVPLMGFYAIVGYRLFSLISLLISRRMKFFLILPSLNLIANLYRDGKARETEAEVGGREVFRELKEDIVLRDLSFSYNDSKPILNRINLVIPFGKMTAIVGPSGCGKSTIADLIAGLFLPKEGTILINGKSLDEYELRSWRLKIIYLTQEVPLFNATVQENITLWRNSSDRIKAEQAARLARAHDFICQLPQGYETVVGDRGVRLSGGQRQRIVIARAIFCNPDLFIFDEPTSALDHESEDAVKLVIQELAKKKTVLVIAHRISTLENADVIYQFDQAGNINLIKFQDLLHKSVESTPIGIF